MHLLTAFAIYQWGVETRVCQLWRSIAVLVRNLPMRSWNTIRTKNFTQSFTLVRNLPMRSWNLSILFLTVLIFLVRNLPMRSWNVKSQSRTVKWGFVRNLPMRSWNKSWASKENFLLICSQFTNEELKPYAIWSRFARSCSSSQFTNEELKLGFLFLQLLLSHLFAIYQWGVETNE